MKPPDNDQGSARGPRPIGRDALMTRLDEVLAALDGSDAGAEQRALLLGLQAEMQGHALRETRDRYARLFDLAPVGYAVLDGLGVIRDVNLTAARLFGHERAALCGDPFATLLEPDDRQPFLDHVRAVLASVPDPNAPDPIRERVWDRVWDLRVRPRTGDGGPRLLRLLSAAGADDGQPACLCALIDVTAEAAAEHARAAGERLRQAVLDALPAEVSVLDAHGRIVAVNRAWRQFASQNDAAPGLRDGVGVDYLSTCRHVIGDDAAEARAVADGLAAVINGDAAMLVREYPCDAPSQRRWFALRAVPLGDGIGGAVVVHFDITERRLAEDEARRARESIAQAARINAVGVLAASLVHELSQPLSAASFFSSTGTALTAAGTGSGDPDTLRRVLGGIDEQIHRATEIVQRLREFLRHREVRMQPVAVERVIEQALGLVRWFAADKNIALRSHGATPELAVAADHLQIEQVIVNLICNSIQAIDAADCRRREVEVIAAREDGFVRISVRDTGPGLPADVHERLFDIFASTRHAGLGMGLAVSRAIVEAHGGRLWAEPDPGPGAVFHFSLPLDSPEPT